MFYKLMHRRAFRHYRKSYLSILIVFAISITLITFVSVYRDSSLYYDTAVLIPRLRSEYGAFRIENVSREYVQHFDALPGVKETKLVDGTLQIHIYSYDDFDTMYDRVDALRKQLGLSGENHGFIVNRAKVELDISTIYMTSVFLLILAAVSAVVMSLIYTDHVNLRRSELETLLAVGAQPKQIRSLFFKECSLLYALSAVIGLPLGTLFAYIMCLFYKLQDMSGSNLTYPVFHIYPVTIPLILLISALTALIAFRLSLRRILRIKPCDTPATVYTGDFRRTGKVMLKKSFGRFFAPALFWRSKFINRVCVGVTSIAIFFVLFTLVMYNLVLSEPDALLLLGVIVFFFCIIAAGVVIYALITLSIFVGRHFEAQRGTIETLLTLGATRKQLYKSYMSEAVIKSAVSLAVGYLFSYTFIFTINKLGLIHSAGYRPLTFDLPFILGNILIGAAILALFIISTRIHFNAICTPDKEDSNAHTENR